jgi:hypothetical protein
METVSNDTTIASGGAAARWRGRITQGLQRVRGISGGASGWRNAVSAAAAAGVLAGFAVMAQSWWDSGSELDIRMQMQDLISAVGGLGLALVAAAILVAEQRRRRRSREDTHLATVAAALQRLADIEESIAGPAAVAAVAGGARVVASPVSYHRPGCELAADQPSLVETTAEVARAGGLRACRVCLPEENA